MAHWWSFTSSSDASGDAVAHANEPPQHQQLPDEDESRVYRPLLFHSTGYASSTLWHDDYEMRTRLPDDPTNQTNSSDEDEDEMLKRPSAGMALLHSNKKHRRQTEATVTRPRHEPIRAQIRLETLTSRAATMVLWVTYASFVFAFAVPYLQSQGFLATTITLPGDECNQTISQEPCTRVDPVRGIATWSAFVNNVSWYAGSIEVRLDIQDVVVNHSLSSDEAMPMGLNALWPSIKAPALRSVWQFNSSELQVIDESFTLQYDISLYGIDFDTVPFTKNWITTERNQSVWVQCANESGTSSCEIVRLLEVAQDFEGMGNNDYGSYLVTLLFRGRYPNAIGRHVTYEFAYTKPAIHMSELLLRSLLLLMTILALPCWLIAVLNFHHGSWFKILSVQKWVFALGVVLMLWQNPIYAVAEWHKSISLRTRFVSAVCESFAEAFFYVFWLHLMDQYGGASRARSFSISKLFFGMTLFAVDVGMTVLRMPKLFFPNHRARSWHRDEFYVLFGFLRIVMLVWWLVWIARISWHTGKYLRTLRYMSSRFQQLSYRFLVLQTLLILIYVVLLTGVQVFFLLQTWSSVGYEAFIQTAVHTFTTLHSGRPSLGKLIFLSVYVYLVLFVHLPPLTTRSLGSTAFQIDEHPRVDQYGFLMPDSHLFCVETAVWLLEIAWQAYYDPPGQPSPFGYGELNLEQYGFELITHLRSQLTDTHVVVTMNHEQTRLVIAFRGTTSKQNWKSNLRFHQEVLWIKSRGMCSSGRQTCLDRLKGCVAKIPIVNMALPRVHSGFWRAYASIRTELKEVIRLVLDEHPGVSVYCTGHSMGGALAVLAAYDLAVNFSIKVNLYNFGGPRVGNPSFAQHFDRCVPSSFRVVMDGDIVPGIPKFWGLYQHVGTEVAIDTEGNLIVDPSFIERQLHVSSKRKVATHPTHVYRTSMAKCLETLVLMK